MFIFHKSLHLPSFNLEIALAIPAINNWKIETTILLDSDLKPKLNWLSLFANTVRHCRQ